MGKNHNREKQWLLRDKYGGRLTAAAKRDLERLKGGEHISYLIGWAPFLNCKIDLSTRPLIPRPETEYWTEQAIREIKKRPGIKVLDLFCGSGCIGIAVLKHVPGANVNFADIEKKYFLGIKKSLRTNRVPTRRARLIQSDVFKNIGSAKYDYILANPPYIPTSGRAMQASVMEQEPHQALFGGKEGTKYVFKVMREAKKYIAPDGTIFIEFDPPQKPDIAEQAKNSGWRPKFFKDQFNRWRFVRLEKKRISGQK